MEMMQEGVSLMPEHSHGHYLLGALYAKYDKIKEAMLCFKRTLELEPTHQKASHNVRHLASKGY